MAPLLLLLFLPSLLAAAAAADPCSSLDLRVESAGRDTATVSLAPPPGTKKIRFEYYTGKFPTIDEVWVKDNNKVKDSNEVKDSGSGKREHYVMTGLDPGTEYSLRVTPECSEGGPCKAGPSPTRSLFSIPSLFPLYPLPSLLSPLPAYLPPLISPPLPLSPLSPFSSPLYPLTRSPLLSLRSLHNISPLNSYFPETTQVVQT